jgi:hypothetical protein
MASPSRLPHTAERPRTQEPARGDQSARRPWARDGWGFNNEVQFLANRGYAVLQMNFRG